MKTCEFCRTQHCIALMYNKGLLVMHTMQRHKTTHEKAVFAVNKFLEKECKRIPDFGKKVNEILSKQIL